MAEPTASSQRLRRRFKIGCAALGLLAALPLMGEVALRLHVSYRYSSNEAYQAYTQRYQDWIAAELGQGGLWKVQWRSYRPGAHLTSETMGMDVRINEHGFRSRPFSVEPAPGTYRILVLGGSTTMGGSTTDATWPAQLEDALAQASRAEGVSKIEVLNLAVSGADLALSRWRLTTEAERFKPDAVLLYHGVNCIKGRRPLWPTSPRAAMSFLNSELFDALTLDSKNSELFLGTCGGQFVELQGIATWCEERELPLFVCTFAIPRREQFDEGTWEFFSLHSRSFWVGRDMDVYTWSVEQWNGFLRLWAQKRAPFTLLDLEPRLTGAYFQDPCHLEDEGLAEQGRAVAELLKPHLVKLKVLAAD